MVTELIDYLKNKKIMILGFGREGKSTYKFIRKHLKEQLIYISDQKENFWSEEELLQGDEKIICYSGEEYLDHLEEYDVKHVLFCLMDFSFLKHYNFQEH